jgi:hypothetical protein
VTSFASAISYGKFARGAGSRNGSRPVETENTRSYQGGVWLAVYDLHIGKHKLDIRFWREGEETAFEVIKGDPKLVERCDCVSKIAQLRTGSDTNTCA